MSATKRQEESAAKDLDSGALAARLAELADSKGADGDRRPRHAQARLLHRLPGDLHGAQRAPGEGVGDEVKLRLKNEEGLLPAGTDGEDGADWIVVDFLDAVLHVFTEDARQRYQLEDLWREAPRVESAVSAA